VKGLTELVSHQHKLGIPYFSGYLHEPSIEEWLKEAERVARTAGWDNEMKIRFFGDRLRHMALALHEDLLSKWVKPNFNQWKSAMLERFQDKSAQDWNCSNKSLHNELWILEVKSTRSTRRLTAQVPL
jgi:pantoate kinase